jgi:large subunit ribosomal protein L3
MSNLSGMIGRKVGMTRIFSEDGQIVPVTVLEVGPCTVLQKKTVKREGYNAIQFGFFPKPLSKLKLPEQGHVKKADLSEGFRYIREVMVDQPDVFNIGQIITLKDLEIVKRVDVESTSKGRGFAGAVKRHGFSRGPMGHGSKHHRAVGSAGQSADPSKVIKGRKMPGHMGGNQVTVKNLMVVDIRDDENLLLVKGCVPGSINQLVCVRVK